MLNVAGLHAGYGRVEVLRGIDLRVEEGEIVCLVGANGAGKSTLLKAVSGLVSPTAGSVSFLGQEITGWRPERIVRLGLSQVPEGRHIFAGLTVEQNLLLGAYVHGSRKAELERLHRVVFELFPILDERFQRRAGTLSGGEQQMLAIGRALMSEPKLVLLDEPSLGLAPLVVKQIFEIIQGLRARGIPILVVEQNVSAVLQIADRAYVLETGRIAGHGLASELLADDEVKRRYLGM
ncbi:MAG: ABC transporter ATP-binding protein [Deltaproteobacteria bacterium]|nr:ABC transporter ATP-binding protein [Deltaproteobacteria bacterium]